MFTYADGRPIRPEYLTHRFRTVIKELDLPPIRLHDLRHGAATPALASHTDLKVIQQMLGHSSIVTTAGTYIKSRELHQPGEKLQVSRSLDRRNSIPPVLMPAL
jgi:integrase